MYNIMALHIVYMANFYSLAHSTDRDKHFSCWILEQES